MIKGLTGAGLGNVGGIESFVALASKYGFGAVDAGGLDRWIADKGLEEARGYLQNHNVVIGTIGLPVEWRQSEDQFRAGLTALTREAEAAAKLGCTSCCTYVLPSTDHKAAHFTVLATRRLRTCAQILGAYGIRLGIEFVGPHHLRTHWKHPFLWTIEETLDWIAAIGEPNVGLLFDAYHWYTTEGTVEDILKLKPEQIVHVHINDAKPVPVSEAKDNERLYPGEGVIDLGGFLRALDRIGYRGVVAQEILTPQPPADSVEALLQRSADGYSKVYRAAGLE